MIGEKYGVWLEIYVVDYIEAPRRRKLRPLNHTHSCGFVRVQNPPLLFSQTKPPFLHFCPNHRPRIQKVPYVFYFLPFFLYLTPSLLFFRSSFIPQLPEFTYASVPHALAPRSVQVLVWYECVNLRFKYSVLLILLSSVVCYSSLAVAGLGKMEEKKIADFLLV